MDSGNKKGNSVEDDSYEQEEFIVVPYGDQGKSHLEYKLEIRASFAGKRIRRFFSDKGAAITEGNSLVKQIKDHGVKSVDNAGLTTRKAVEWFLSRPKLLKASKKHQSDTKAVLDLLVNDVGGKQVEHVTAEEIEKIVNIPDNETTQANYFAKLHMMFRALDRFEKISKNPMKALDKPVTKPRRNILTPAEMKKTLEAQGKIPDWLHVCNLLGGFPGLRTCEMLRMDLKDINVTSGQIHVTDEAAKDTNTDEYDDRIVDFTPQLIRRKPFLRKFIKEQLAAGITKLVPVNEDAFYDARKRLVKLLRWEEWPDNCLRHSAATYKLAECGNAAVVANMLGHKSSIRLVTKTYAVPAKKADWKAWRAL